MPEMMTTDVRAIMDRTPFDVAAVADLRELLNRDPSRYRTLREAVANIRERERKENKAETHLRLGVGEVLLGRYNSGLEHLKRAGEVGMAYFFRGLALENQQQYDQAAEAFSQAHKLGYDPKNSELHRAGALRRAGHVPEARKILAGQQKLGGSSAEYHFQQGCLLSADGELAAAAAEFEKALSLDKDHNGALFELAYINDIHGNDDLAVDYYKRCTERLFVKDCQASKGMYYDEEAERGYTVLKQLHEIPVTDFELSVRSRNCLRKMNIRTLGDLTRTTEAALLSSKNFGETSLAEIKEMMQAKGLRLGMALEGDDRGHDHRIEPPQEVPPEMQMMLSKPIGDLNLSVRARKCMSKLNIQTLGDLLKHTGDELLECKNFGITSLNEVRDKLSGMGLKLKND
jgi:DNA-directed RNA polymerase subunit alpha